jgi:hypothetical protein
MFGPLDCRQLKPHAGFQIAPKANLLIGFLRIFIPPGLPSIQAAALLQSYESQQRAGIALPRWSAL